MSAQNATMQQNGSCRAGRIQYDCPCTACLYRVSWRRMLYARFAFLGLGEFIDLNGDQAKIDRDR